MKFKLINGMIILKGFVESDQGSQDLECVVDTGSSMTTIDTSILDRIGYGAIDGDHVKDVFTADKADKQGYTLKVKKFKTCGIELGDFKVLSYDLLDDPRYEKIDCLIGYNFLRHFKVIINYKNQEIFFEEN